MGNKLKQYLGIFFLLFIIGGIVTAKPCLAASAEIEISSDKTAITVGDTIYIYITIDSDTLFGDFEANLTYEDNIFEYQGGAKVITGSNGFLKISDMGITEGSNTRKYTLKFEALQVGTSEISFSGPAMVSDFNLEREMSISSNVLTLEVKATETASNNANLKSLRISPAVLTPEFNKNIVEYNVNVSYVTENLIIDALPEDNKATVSISGNDFLKEGENKVIVTVLAESGDVIEYTIKVLRDIAPEEENTSEEITPIPGSENGVFEIVLIGNEKFAIYSGKYKIIEPTSDVQIPSGYTQTKLIVSDISIPVYSTKDFGSDFLLIYAMNELGEEGFYQYDRIEKTLQRYVPDGKSGFDNTADTNEEDNMQAEEYRSNLNKAAVVIALLSTLCVLLIAVLILMVFKLKRHKADDLD
jgi:hypothetical protein